MDAQQDLSTVEDLRLSELRLVTLIFQDTGDAKTHIVPAADVPKLAEATVRLHHTPGVNPSTGNPTRKICMITAEPMALYGPYWWTTPSLEGNGDDTGARVIQGNCHREIPLEDKEFFAKRDAKQNSAVARIESCQ
ncbi:hypothetical protein [Microvirga massiliensis]|uniref:hypothetical protein n=1 Tax=Microvirga massiliensis TaxID=1033741 RepID=UPI00062B6157|nr:hypothetical protein [Microvirga massiliensis]